MSFEFCFVGGNVMLGIRIWLKVFGLGEYMLFLLNDYVVKLYNFEYFFIFIDQDFF